MHQDLQYLKNGHINDIAMMLTDNVYLGTGDMDYFAVRERLMKAIVEWFLDPFSGHSFPCEDFILMSVEGHADKPTLTLFQAACLVLSVWKHMDYQHNITRKKLDLAEQAIASARPNHAR
jgi:hypothetical protein